MDFVRLNHVLIASAVSTSSSNETSDKLQENHRVDTEGGVIVSIYFNKETGL